LTSEKLWNCRTRRFVATIVKARTGWQAWSCAWTAEPLFASVVKTDENTDILNWC
jgi:hypothetical protein